MNDNYTEPFPLARLTPAGQPRPTTAALQIVTCRRCGAAVGLHAAGLDGRQVHDLWHATVDPHDHDHKAENDEAPRGESTGPRQAVQQLLIEYGGHAPDGLVDALMNLIVDYAEERADKVRKHHIGCVACEHPDMWVHGSGYQIGRPRYVRADGTQI